MVYKFGLLYHELLFHGIIDDDVVAWWFYSIKKLHLAA